ncbi:hypothetical protein LZC95_40085 [Pendulispora brunnea]|uniref:Uncharacterized protein n=1 Tax=Pendulispora brunnea TaxID=2905690 RepID=A0ABZ2K4Z7_9BACT
MTAHGYGWGMRAAGFLAIGICSVVVGMVACSGDTFTNEPGVGGDGGPGVDAGNDSGGDGGRPSCAPGVSERAFCSNFDKSNNVRDDKWSVSGAQDVVQVRNGSPFAAKSPPNFLFVDSGDNDHAFVTTNLPPTKRFSLSFEMRLQELGNQSYVAMLLSFCPRSGAGNCFSLRLKFAAPSDAGRQVVVDDGSFQANVGNVEALRDQWVHVALESNLEATANNIGTLRVTFGSDTRSMAILVPSSTIAQVDHVELNLGAVSADTGSGGGFNAYQLGIDTVIFDPAP